jgi:hypothetical protein
MSKKSLYRLLEHYRSTYQLDKAKKLEQQLR